MSIKINKLKKIGILGGTFDPPHIGHVEISKYAIKKFKLSLLIWAITKRNPLKKSPLIKRKSNRMSTNINKITGDGHDPNMSYTERAT